jgi:hypothetical protein
MDAACCDGRADRQARAVASLGTRRPTCQGKVPGADGRQYLPKLDLVGFAHQCIDGVVLAFVNVTNPERHAKLIEQPSN